MLHNLQITFTYGLTEPLWESKGLILLEVVGTGGSQKWSDSLLKVTQVVRKKLGRSPAPIGGLCLLRHCHHSTVK